jgi:hypothetical protein
MYLQPPPPPTLSPPYICNAPCMGSAGGGGNCGKRIRNADHTFCCSLAFASLSTLQTSSVLCVPRNETAGPRSQFPHSCGRFIYSLDRGGAVSFLGIFVSIYLGGRIVKLQQNSNLYNPKSKLQYTPSVLITSCELSRRLQITTAAFFGGFFSFKKLCQPIGRKDPYMPSS